MPLLLHVGKLPGNPSAANSAIKNGSWRDQPKHPPSPLAAAEQDSKRGRGSSSAAAAAADEGGGSGQGGEEKSALDLLTKAVLLYPVVALRLLKKLQEQGSSEWQFLKINVKGSCVATIR